MNQASVKLFENLLASSSHGMARLAVSITCDEDLAQDACQEAYIELLRAMDAARPIHDYRAWLRRVVANKAIAALKARKNPAGGLVSLDAVPLLAADSVKDESNRTALQEAIDQLPADHRAALGLKILDGFTYDDVADTLNCSATSARRLVNAALSSLGQNLQNSRIPPPSVTPEQPST